MELSVIYGMEERRIAGEDGENCIVGQPLGCNGLDESVERVVLTTIDRR